MDVDPLASMRCWAVELELGGRTYEVPALSAVDWWPVLASGDPTRVLDFVVSTPDDPFNLDDLLLDGKVDAAELEVVLRDTIEAVAGRSYHAALVLTVVAANHWASINGELVRRGFRWDDQPLGAALDAVYAEWTGRLSKEGLAEALALLDNEALTGGGRKAKVSQKVVQEFEGVAGPRPTGGVRSTGVPSDSARPRTRTQPRPPRPAAP